MIPSFGRRLASIVVPLPVLAGLTCWVALDRRISDLLEARDIGDIAAPLVVLGAGVLAIAFAARRWAIEWLVWVTLSVFAAAGVTAAIAGPDYYLKKAGTRTSAIVTSEITRDILRKSGPPTVMRVYRFALADGSAVPGELSSFTDDYSTGDRVDIVYDRHGIANPATPSVADGSLRGVDLALLLLLLSVGLAVVTCRVSPSAGPRHPNPPSRGEFRPPYHYPRPIEHP